VAQHIERAFEIAIEEHLLAHGWLKGNPDRFDRELALDLNDALGFIAATQADVWAELRKQHGASFEKTVVEWLVKALDSQGTLHLLRYGFKFYGKLLRLAFFQPTHGLNPDLVAKAAKNRLVVTRQVKFDPKSDKSLDMVLSLNGLPIATVELKNPLTAQTVEHGIEQYRNDRDPKLAIFQFKKRSLVHFALDPDVVYMTTRLQGKETTFLPFNRGNGTGAGNPDVKTGYKTSYLWEEVWERSSFLDILARFMHLSVEEKQVVGEKKVIETVIFPRYHQLDSVRKLEAAARVEGPGNNYLIQHSAGSGKSNSIAWLAYRLAELHDAKDERVFQSVVVVTDRRVLDKQLQDTIHQFEHKLGVVQKIDDNSKQLADALTAGTPIIITTLQKFPFVAAKIAELPNRTYAVIVDEAHSSQGGESAAKLKEVLRERSAEPTTPEEAQLAAAEAATADPSDAVEDDAEEQLQRVMASRGRQKNLSFFAFTATPKPKTLEAFGKKDAEGKPRPFHLYSMRQAIEEHFILDVLQNYTTYKTFYRLANATSKDPVVPKREAAAQLARFVSIHPHNIAQKTEVMVEHFRQKVRHKIGGKAKAMAVTSSRLHAVRYRKAFDAYIKEKGYKDIGVLVAFSGEVEDPSDGLKFTEPGMNAGIKEKELPDRFASDEFNILLVANKYQTGFDQPRLHSMYVDKRLSGVQAVQTLSRLNRTAKGKEDTFVLDFVNNEEEIRRSFQPYYEHTTVSDTADPQHLYRLQHELEAARVYTDAEVKAFCNVFYKPKAKQAVGDNAEMYRLLQPAVGRFNDLDEDDQEDFRVALTAFVHLYSFLSQIISFADADLERLYTFGRFLELKLPQDPRKTPLKLDAETVLAYYRLDRIREGSIALVAGEEMALSPPTEMGIKRVDQEQAKLSEVIQILNERFGTNFTKADQLFFDSLIEHAKQDETVRQRAAANTLDNFALAMKAKLRDAIVDRMDQNEQIATRYLNEQEFEELAFKEMVKRIYADLNLRDEASR
jgi:type I restriction enzyme R subunit